MDNDISKLSLLGRIVRAHVLNATPVLLGKAHSNAGLVFILLLCILAVVLMLSGK